ncbi:hypothetical protein [Rhizobium sp. A37_96]
MITVFTLEYRSVWDYGTDQHNKPLFSLRQPGSAYDVYSQSGEITSVFVWYEQAPTARRPLPATWAGRKVSVNPLDISRKQVDARGIPVGSRESFEAMNRAIEGLDPKPVMDRVFPWADVEEAMRYFAVSSNFGKWFRNSDESVCRRRQAVTSSA